MSFQSTICLIKDFPITRTDTTISGGMFTWDGDPDDMAYSNDLRSLSENIQELRKHILGVGATLSFMYNSANECCIWFWTGFPQRLCSILPKPFLQIRFKEELPPTDAVDKITIDVRLDLKKIVENSQTTKWIIPFSRASTGCKADIFLGWTGPANIPIRTTQTSTRVDFECFIFNLFEENFSKDLTIVAGNGAEIKCHRRLLEAHSDVLSAMKSPKNEMPERKNGRIEMLEISEEGLTHLVRYLDGIELKIDDLPCNVAVELFKTAHKYKFAELLKWLDKILIKMGADWFPPDDLLELYLHVKNLAEFKVMEEHLLCVIIHLGKTIRTCDRFHELTRTDSDAAIELLSVLFDMLNERKK